MHHSETDRVLVRGKDIGLIIGIVTLAIMVWKLYQKPSEWDNAYSGLRVLTPRVEAVERRVAEFEARNNAQMSYIIKELEAISRKVGR